MARKPKQLVGRRQLNLQSLEAREVPATTITLVAGVSTIQNTTLLEGSRDSQPDRAGLHPVDHRRDVFTVPGVEVEHIKFTNILTQRDGGDRGC